MVDTIYVTLDLDQLQVSYKINDEDHGVAFRDIEATEYKACLCVHYKGDTVDLVSYTNC